MSQFYQDSDTSLVLQWQRSESPHQERNYGQFRSLRRADESSSGHVINHGTKVTFYEQHPCFPLDESCGQNRWTRCQGTKGRLQQLCTTLLIWVNQHSSPVPFAVWFGIKSAPQGNLPKLREGEGKLGSCLKVTWLQ